MSFSLNVIPAEKEPISFAAFKQCWLATLEDNRELTLAADIGLYRTIPDDEAKDDDLLDIGPHWRFRHSANTALTLQVSRNADSYIDVDAEYLRYYAQDDLEAREVSKIAEGWIQAGYSFTLTSYIGRHKEETALMCVVAMALAKCTKGRVLVTEWRVFYKNGLFTPAQFRENMRFMRNMR